MLRCRSVLFSDVVNPTVRFGYILYPTARFCAVFRHRQTHGAVRCGFQEGKNPTVRYGADNRTEPLRTDRKNRTVKNPEKYKNSNIRQEKKKEKKRKVEGSAVAHETRVQNFKKFRV